MPRTKRPSQPARRRLKTKPTPDARETISATIAAMRVLRASGDRSFEELIARLLSKLSGERIRRCTAGSQGGVDALAEIPFAIEDKRYARAVRSRDLEGGLTSAAGTHPELQLWALVATCAVGVQAREAVVNAGLRQGVGVLVLDATSAEPDLPGVSTLAALAATDVETTLEVLADPTWRVGRDTPNLRAIRRELTVIRNLPNYAAWKARLRRELRDLPTWRHLVRSQNMWLRSLILGDAANAFGTRYDPADAIPRSAEADLTTWWKACATAAACEVAVVTGDRYDGKTWLVYRWLSAALPRFDVPVFVFSSTQVQAAYGDLETLILRQCERALGPFARHARDVLVRHQSRRAGAGAWCLVILDGANEYVAAPEARAAAIVWAVPPAVQPFVESGDMVIAGYPEGREDDPVDDVRRCGLLMTCRARDFDTDASWLGTRPVRRIELGPYDADEFRAALARRSLSPEQLADLPASALEMVHRPRYFDLMLHHQPDVARFGAVTADVLHYLDASDKVSSREATAVRQDPAAFKAFLARLADRWIQGGRLTHADVWADLRSVTDRVEQSLRALTSEGVLTPRADGTFVPDLNRLALGMGLFLRDRLLAVTDAVQLGQTLADLLEPHPDDDEKVRWLRAAVTVSVLAGDIADNPHVVQALLGTWLASRNFSQADLDDLRVLAPQLLLPVLDLLAVADARSEIVFLFAEPIIAAGIAADEAAVARTVRHWCRLVPVGFPRYIGDAEGEKPAVVAARMADPSLADLGLTLPGSMRARTIRACQRLALFLASTRPSLLRPEDVLALLAARHATSDDLGQGEQYAVRIILRDSSATWFMNEVRSWTAQPTATGTVLFRELIVAADRGDLRELLAALPEPTYYHWRDGALTRSQLATLAPGHDEKETLQLAGRARLLALDPTSPAPPRRWRAALGTTAVARFAGSVTLHAFNCTSRDDLDLEEVEPALAAWTPAAGALIWRQFIADIPRRLAAKEESWSWTIEGHAALLTPPDRRKLLELVRMPPHDDADRRHALERAYCCVLASAPPAERLRLLLEHPFEQEWTTLYDVAAAPYDEMLRQRTLAIVRRERDPRRLRRARLLLGYLRADLTPADVARLGETIANPDARDEDEHAADFLLRNVRVDDSTPLAAFGPLVVAAGSAAEAAWQYSAFLDRERHRGALTGIGLPRALAAPETARRRGAAPDASDDVAVAEGIARLAEEVRGGLARSLANPTFGEGEQFPETIADAISDASFDEWVRLLLALPRHARHAHVGILMAVVPRALRTRHVAARELWALVYPFQRTRVAFGTRFTVKSGLDWTLRLIHDPTLDDALATALLRDLIADCRSDSELVSVALGARLRSTTRLAVVVADGLASDDPATRARARFVAGWMPEDSVHRTRLAAPDPSRWVERNGQRALHRLDRERWAREWLRRFLMERSRTRRWAAGRLFLECTDAATPFWTDDVLYGERELAYPTRRAEAELLLWRVRAKPDDSALRDNFLGYRVRELADVVPPWREPTEWEDVQERRDE
jgi:hypothetical protein